MKIGINEIETYASLDLCSDRENKLQFSEPLSFSEGKFFKSHTQNGTLFPESYYLARQYFANGLTALPSVSCS